NDDGDEQLPTTKTLRKRSSQQLPYHIGMHLAPMVRIGTLPVRLVALEYGAELVWGPEIVDKAIIGAERKVDPRTGVVSFLKNGRSIFDCHPLEKSRLIFQLGSASPELAVQAMKVIEQDVAGVGLNCGCPKSFSLSGGMGAALLKEPEKLCSILTALVKATDLPVDAKIRLLPLPPKGDAASAAASSLATPPTLALVARIFDTGIANLTVHCRTQQMRSREPALHERMRGITEMGKQRGVPVVCNGDAVGGGKDAGWGNFDQVCEKTGVSSVMIARAAEANPSCFSRSGLADPISEVIPKLL
ncbi:FMN-linked oxidoreductase, partial [Rhodotorula sp. JG-1b]